MPVYGPGGATDSGDVGLALYQSLRVHGSAVPEQAEAALGLTEEEAEAGWNELRSLGLIRDGRFPQEVDSVEPDTALLGLLSRQREALRVQSEELAATMRAAETLMNQYRPAVLRETLQVDVELVIGDSQKRQMLGDFASRVSVTTDSMHPGPLPPPDMLAGSLQSDADLISRDIKVRAIYGQSVNSGPRQRKYLADLAAVGVEVRLAPQVPFDPMIGDSATVLLPSDPNDPSYAAIVVRGTALVASYVAVFEDCWLRSVPYSPELANSADGHDDLTEQHRTIMRLLANGLTDERIARRLGVSLRTVSRLVSENMRYLQAESRFQAGVLAAAHGLV
ncbi:MAG TPA: LuxR C-terminal-related transcriptional regulator [Streptomyces sp.]